VVEASQVAKATTRKISRMHGRCGLTSHCRPRIHSCAACAHPPSLIRQVAAALLRFSAELGIDAPKRAKWQGLLDGLAQFPIEPYQGVPIIAEVSKTHVHADTQTPTHALCDPCFHTASISSTDNLLPSSSFSQAPGVPGINNENYVIVYYAPIFPGKK
jgi:hypothetical protein